MDLAQNVEQFVRSQLGDFQPKLAFILGSGLGHLIDEMKVVTRIPYTQCEGFFSSTVVGHKGEFVFGHLEGVPVACMNGRVHLYEGASREQLCAPIRLMRRLGCETLLLTNATGCLGPHLSPGSLVLIKDQINMSGVNVLVGENAALYGPRFQGMENAYDADLRKLFQQSAQTLKIEVQEGTYIGVMGPSYETPAEIRFFGSMGGDIVGMSTVNEVIAARHCGLKVVGLSLVSNYGAGLSETRVNHEEVVTVANQAGGKMSSLIRFVLNHHKKELIA